MCSVFRFFQASVARAVNTSSVGRLSFGSLPRPSRPGRALLLAAPPRASSGVTPELSEGWLEEGIKRLEISLSPLFLSVTANAAWFVLLECVCPDFCARVVRTPLQSPSAPPRTAGHLCAISVERVPFGRWRTYRRCVCSHLYVLAVDAVRSPWTMRGTVL